MLKLGAEHLSGRMSGYCPTRIWIPLGKSRRTPSQALFHRDPASQLQPSFSLSQKVRDTSRRCTSRWSTPVFDSGFIHPKWMEIDFVTHAQEDRAFQCDFQANASFQQVDEVRVWGRQCDGIHFLLRQMGTGQRIPKFVPFLLVSQPQIGRLKTKEYTNPSGLLFSTPFVRQGSAGAVFGRLRSTKKPTTCASRSFFRTSNPKLPAWAAVSAVFFFFANGGTPANPVGTAPGRPSVRPPS